MPIYEYACSACGERFDRLQGMTAAPDPACPSCGAGESRRLISLVAGLGSSSSSPAPSGSSGCGCGGACACGR